MLNKIAIRKVYKAKDFKVKIHVLNAFWRPQVVSRGFYFDSESVCLVLKSESLVVQGFVFFTWIKRPSSSKNARN